jgi:hypothetical protein
VSSLGLGLVFVPLSLVSLRNVAEQDSGVASRLLKTAQQVGVAIGLAVLGTVAWTTVADSLRTQLAHAGIAAKPGSTPPASIYHQALTDGFSRAFEVAARIVLLALLIAIATIRVSRQELSGAVPEPQESALQPAAPQPGLTRAGPVPIDAVQADAVQRHEDRAARAAAASPCRLC